MYLSIYIYIDWKNTIILYYIKLGLNFEIYIALPTFGDRLIIAYGATVIYGCLTGTVNEELRN